MAEIDEVRREDYESEEDYMDVLIAVKASEEYEKDPVSYSSEEVMRMLGDEEILDDDE